MPADAESTGPAGVQYVITLVHGTWAKNALWVGADSALLKALRERFGERAKAFPPFEWTGANSHRARREASEKLKKELGPRLENYGGARHYLICHSHGGNVALRALAGSGFQEKIAGVVFLATPFLVARQRDLGRNPWKHLGGALTLIWGLAMWMVYRVLLPASWPDLGRLAVTVLIGSVMGGILSVLVTKWREHAEKLRRDFASPAIKRDKIVIIRSPADEASAALALFQCITQLSVRLFVGSQRLYNRVEAVASGWAKQKGKMLAVAAIALMVYVGFAFVVVYRDEVRALVEGVLPWEARVKSWVNTAGAVGLCLSLLVSAEAILLVLRPVEQAQFVFFFYLVTSMVVWPVIALLSVLLLPFGWQVALANILLDVTAETTPLGSWMVHLIEPPTSEELGKDAPPLMHSVVYENPRVLEFVCNWIANGDGAARR